MCKWGPQFTDCIHLCTFIILILLFSFDNMLYVYGTSLMLRVSRSRYQTWKTELTNAHFPALNLWIQIVCTWGFRSFYTSNYSCSHTFFFFYLWGVLLSSAIQIVQQSLQSRVFGNCSLMFDHSDSDSVLT